MNSPSDAPSASLQANGAAVTTAEGVTEPDGSLGLVQTAFREQHGLQCGFCTPGMILNAKALLAKNPDPSEEDVREMLAGNYCRCTGYVKPVEAVLAAAKASRRAR